MFLKHALGALLLASEVVFTVIKFVSAVYLIYLGYKLFTTKAIDTRVKGEETLSIKKCFTTSALSNLSNPKITVFYFAYLPQFISLGQENPMLVFLLGTVFALLTLYSQSSDWLFGGQVFKLAAKQRIDIEMV